MSDIRHVVWCVPWEDAKGLPTGVSLHPDERDMHAYLKEPKETSTYNQCGAAFKASVTDALFRSMGKTHARIWQGNYIECAARGHITREVP